VRQERDDSAGGRRAEARCLAAVPGVSWLRRRRNARRDDIIIRTKRRSIMAKKQSAREGVYRVTEVIGTSTTSWEDAAAHAVTTASKTLRDLRVAEIAKLDMKIEGGKIVAYRARVQLSFKYDG
jgi:flavin-binding protein dodecin